MRATRSCAPAASATPHYTPRGAHSKPANGSAPGSDAARAAAAICSSEIVSGSGVAGVDSGSADSASRGAASMRSRVRGAGGRACSCSADAAQAVLINTSKAFMELSACRNKKNIGF